MKRFMLLIPLLLCASIVHAAEYRTSNFTVYCSDADLAKNIGDSAEFYRAKHAKEWLGSELPKWYAPCPIRVKQGNIGNGGSTTFIFDRGEVTGWDMQIQGAPQKLLDDVVPHEVLHTVFATHYRRMLPRWADEGACTYCESESERKRNRLIVLEELQPGEMIPIRTLLTLPEYPRDGRKTAVFYGQSFLLSEYLIDLKGKREFVAFLQSYFKSNDWSSSFRKHYGYQSPELAYSEAVHANRPLSDTLEVKLVTDDPCIYCDKAKAETVPALKKKGVKVSYVNKADSPESVNGVPVFLLYRNGKRVSRVDGLSSAAVIMAEFRKSQPKTVQVAQGVGIGYFGQIGGNKSAGSKPNPHNDLSAAQTQLVNQIVDQRSQMAIDGTITARLSDLKAVIDAQIKNAILEIQANLTDEQKALINATSDQKAKIAGFAEQIAAVEAGKAAFIDKHEKALVEFKAQNEALAKEVETAKTETAGLKEKLAGLAKEGASTAASAAMGALGWSGPPSFVLGIVGGLATFLWNRRKKEQIAKT